MRFSVAFSLLSLVSAVKGDSDGPAAASQLRGGGGGERKLSIDCPCFDATTVNGSPPVRCQFWESGTARVILENGDIFVRVTDPDECSISQLGSSARVTEGITTEQASTCYDLLDGVCDIATAKKVFVSSATYKGWDIQSAANADSLCQGMADAAGISGTYMAWLSDDTTTPFDRFNQDAGIYHLLDGTIVAFSWDDLTDGLLQHEINMDEKYKDVSGAVWTGTNNEGMRAPGGKCNNWSSPSVTSTGSFGGFEYAGRTDTAESKWSFFGGPPSLAKECDDSNHIFCFEQ